MSNPAQRSESYPSLPQPKKRRSILRGVGISPVVAVALMAILSFMFSSCQSPTQTAGNGSSTTVGAASQPQQQSQNGISSGKQVCNFAGELNPKTKFPWPAEPAWSSQGQIAVGGYTSFKVLSANDCTTAFSKPLQKTYATKWSPDGSKLVTVSQDDNSYYVLDNHGNTVAHLSASQLESTDADDNVVWSSDGSKLIFHSSDASIKSIAITGNGSPKTLMTVPSNARVSLLSPDGKYALLHATNNFEVWDVNGRKQISTISPTDNSSTDNPPKFSTWAFSPDGSLLAFGKSGQIQIYTTADGKQQSFFSSAKTGPESLGIDLAWSPDGKYLAAGTNAVSIYDVNAKKAVETLGQGDAQHQVGDIAWSPDSKELISSVITRDNATLSVWALS